MLRERRGHRRPRGLHRRGRVGRCSSRAPKRGGLRRFAARSPALGSVPAVVDFAAAGSRSFRRAPRPRARLDPAAVPRLAGGDGGRRRRGSGRGLGGRTGFLLANWFFTPPPLHVDRRRGRARPHARRVPRRGADGSGYVVLAFRRVAAARPAARARATTPAPLAAGDDADPDRLAHLLEHLREAFGAPERPVLGRDEADDDGCPLRPSATAPPRVAAGRRRRPRHPVH